VREGVSVSISRFFTWCSCCGVGGGGYFRSDWGLIVAGGMTVCSGRGGGEDECGTLTWSSRCGVGVRECCAEEKGKAAPASEPPTHPHTYIYTDI
jgi:hypothetical protein